MESRASCSSARSQEHTHTQGQEQYRERRLLNLIELRLYGSATTRGARRFLRRRNLLIALLWPGRQASRAQPNQFSPPLSPLRLLCSTMEGLDLPSESVQSSRWFSHTWLKMCCEGGGEEHARRLLVDNEIDCRLADNTPPSECNSLMRARQNVHNQYELWSATTWMIFPLKPMLRWCRKTSAPLSSLTDANASLLSTNPTRTLDCLPFDEPRVLVQAGLKQERTNSAILRWSENNTSTAYNEDSSAHLLLTCASPTSAQHQLSEFLIIIANCCPSLAHDSLGRKLFSLCSNRCYWISRLARRAIREKLSCSSLPSRLMCFCSALAHFAMANGLGILAHSWDWGYGPKWGRLLPSCWHSISAMRGVVSGIAFYCFTRDKLAIEWLRVVGLQAKSLATKWQRTISIGWGNCSCWMWYMNILTIDKRDLSWLLLLQLVSQLVESSSGEETGGFGLAKVRSVHWANHLNVTACGALTKGWVWEKNLHFALQCSAQSTPTPAASWPNKFELISE